MSAVDTERDIETTMAPAMDTERDIETTMAAAIDTERDTPTASAGSWPDPYAAILEFAERELELARDGRIEDLRSMAPQWDALTAGLPERPPSSARTPLERAAALHERTSATLQCLREALLCDLRTTVRASRAAHGYAGHAPRRVHRVDHSA